MNTIWYRVARLLHPITLAVILVGVAGFLIGLIVAVEQQDAAIVAPRVNAEASSRIARLETALAGRDSEVAGLQAELAKQRDEAPSSAELADVESRITGLAAALADRSTELTALQSELDELSGQLAEAIQERDELRKDSEQSVLDRESLRQELEQARQDRDAQREEREQASRDHENELASLEQTIAGLRRDLEVAVERAPSPEPEVAAREEAPPAAAETTAPEQPAAASNASAKPAEIEPEKTAPADPARAEPAEPKQQSAAPPAPRGPISQGVLAYRAADYRKAYALWLPPALKGSPRAQFFIGALYFEGRGVPEDRVLSYMWLRAATRKDDPGAIKLLDKIRVGMSGPELAEAETRIANGETIPAR